MLTKSLTRPPRFLALALLAPALLCGCSKDVDLAGLTSPRLGPAGPADAARAVGATRAVTEGGETRPQVVPVTFAGESLSLWPFTGTVLDGTPSDPVNLLFVGQADPIAIRDALLSLDGDRTALGFPPVYPFNARWTDAVGDAQTNFTGGDGWSGSTIQLQLGVFEPVRVHLRLFRTGQAFGATGVWTVGAAHFEVLIPGTADHQVLSWELAEQIVAADLLRSGLLDAAHPVEQTAPINDAPAYHQIPDFIYNSLPPDLIGLIGGPAAPVQGGVGVATDGRATILHLAGRAPNAGPRREHFTIQYAQAVPRPFCADGPSDWIFVTGPVTFDKSAAVDASGRYTFRASYTGRLTATPVDITQNPPVPVGTPFEAAVGEDQKGELDARGGSLLVHSRKLIPGHGGSEFQTLNLRVSTDGANRADLETRCR
jgi:hypothetical protein